MNNYLTYGLGAGVVLVAASLTVRRFRSRAPHCPVCLRLGRSSYLGRNHCSACGADFLFDEARRPVPTLWRAAIGPFV